MTTVIAIEDLTEEHLGARVEVKLNPELDEPDTLTGVLVGWGTGPANNPGGTLAPPIVDLRGIGRVQPIDGTVTVLDD